VAILIGLVLEFRVNCPAVEVTRYPPFHVA